MEKLIIGLPDGRHIRKQTYKLLTESGFLIPEYSPNFLLRKYQTFITLPSGNTCKIFIDQTRDLLYGLCKGTCDAIITGQDYVEDFQKFMERNLGVPLFANGDMICSGHNKLQHLAFPNAKLAFVVQKNTPGDNLEQYIAERKSIVCYSEFPMLASSFIMNTSAYKKKYGNKRPTILSTFSQEGINKNVVIVYSHGSTESKAVQDSNTLILDILITGKTQRENNLRVLEFVGGPIFNCIYKRKNLLGSKNKVLKEFVAIIERTTIEKQKIKE